MEIEEEDSLIVKDIPKPANWIIEYGPYRNTPEDEFQFKNFDYHIYFCNALSMETILSNIQNLLNSL